MLMGQDMYTGGEKRKKQRFMNRHVIARHRNPSWKAIKPSKKIGDSYTQQSLFSFEICNRGKCDCVCKFL